MIDNMQIAAERLAEMMVDEVKANKELNTQQNKHVGGEYFEGKVFDTFDDEEFLIVIPKAIYPMSQAINNTIVEPRDNYRICLDELRESLIKLFIDDEQFFIAVQTAVIDDL